SAGLLGFAVDPASGSLSALAPAPIPSQSSPAIADPLGRFLYGGNGYGPQKGVWAYRIDADSGALAPVARSPFGAGAFSRRPFLALDPLGRVLFATQEGAAEFGPEGQDAPPTSTVPGFVRGYGVDPQSGALGELPGSPWETGIVPSRITLDPGGTLVTVHDSGVCTHYCHGYWLQPGAFFFPLQPSSAAPQPPALRLASASAELFEPSGRFLYRSVVSRTDRTWRLDAYRLIQGGLASVPEPAAFGPAEVLSAAFHPRRPLLYLVLFQRELEPAAEERFVVRTYAIDPQTGRLTIVGQEPIPFGDPGLPGDLTVHPTGALAFLKTVDPPELWVHPIDAQTGRLSGTPRARLPLGPAVFDNLEHDLVLEASGHFLYVLSRDLGADGHVADYLIFGFEVHAASRELTPVPASPVHLPVSYASALVAVRTSGASDRLTR